MSGGSGSGRRRRAHPVSAAAPRAWAHLLAGSCDLWAVQVALKRGGSAQERCSCPRKACGLLGKLTKTSSRLWVDEEASNHSAWALSTAAQRARQRHQIALQPASCWSFTALSPTARGLWRAIQC